MIEVTRELDNTYLGFVFKEEEKEELTLSVFIDGEVNFIRITDRNTKLNNLKQNQACLAIVDFLDGTESVDYYYAELNNFNDIFIWFIDLFTIELYEDKPMYEHLQHLYEKSDNYFDHIKKLICSEKYINKITEYKNFDEKWVETHLKP